MSPGWWPLLLLLLLPCCLGSRLWARPDASAAGRLLLLAHAGRGEVALGHVWGARLAELRQAGPCLRGRHRLSPGAAVSVCQLHLGAHVFGGLESLDQVWPIEGVRYDQYPYVTNANKHQAVVERYWLFSDGRLVYVQPQVPLFIDQNTNRSADALCFVAENKAPYPEEAGDGVLEWDLCLFDDVKRAHQYGIENYLGRPTAAPDERMAAQPIWSTWARYKRAVDDARVRQLAGEVVANGFPGSQIEIDDSWETCYGSLTFDAAKFPDVRRLTDDLHSLGFRVTLWVHPFINSNCEPVYSEARDNGYLVSNAKGSTLTVWWNGSGATVDFTNPEAVAWWTGRLEALLNETGIDSFKFDGGESSYLPRQPLVAPRALSPDVFTQRYAGVAARFGPLVEVRVGVRSQSLPVFVRMIDLDSAWAGGNGLSAVVPKLLQMGLAGYPFVLPDMVGGNGYRGTAPTAELFVRWLQANLFMPAVQFSYVPWDFDNETVEMCRRLVELRAQHGPLIARLMQAAVDSGAPLNLPLWWLDPADEAALTIDSEYLLGEDLLVAPVLEEGAVSRDVYLPRGSWRDEVDPEHPVYEGPVWLYNYSAPLDTLPYFTRLTEN